MPQPTSKYWACIEWVQPEPEPIKPKTSKEVLEDVMAKLDRAQLILEGFVPRVSPKKEG